MKELFEETKDIWEPTEGFGFEDVLGTKKETKEEVETYNDQD